MLLPVRFRPNLSWSSYTLAYEDEVHAPSLVARWFELLNGDCPNFAIASSSAYAATNLDQQQQLLVSQHGTLPPLGTEQTFAPNTKKESTQIEVAMCPLVPLGWKPSGEDLAG